jgi:UDP-glucose 4-epimerase
MEIGTQPKPLTRWLITGGCGFIGRNLVKNIVEEEGHFIRIVDNLSFGTREDLAQVCEFTEVDPNIFKQGSQNSDTDLLLSSNLNSKNLHDISTRCTSMSTGSCQLIAADILDAELALNVTRGIDTIVHLAANTGVVSSVKNPPKDCEVNVNGTLNYLEAARFNRVRRFVFASSGAPIGECRPPIHEELAPHPVSPYGASKLAGEGYCSAYYRTFGIETIALRFGNVYGPLSGHKSSVVAKFVNLATKGKPLEIFGEGTQTRDFIFVDDLVMAIRLAAIKDNIGGEIFQIATNRETTVLELTEKLIKELTWFGINDVQVRHTAPRTGDVKRNFSNTEKAKTLLGWQAEVKLQEGLKKTVQWFLNHHKKGI